MRQPYAFFDVDGTVIRTDSFRRLLLAGFSQAWWRVFLTVPFLVLAPLSLVGVDKRYIKSAMLWCMTVGLGKKRAVQLLRSALRDEWSTLWFPQMNVELAKLRADGLRICYVSASGQMWLRSLLSAMDPGPKIIIGSKLGYFCGGVVFRSKNCYQAEKLCRIAERLGNDISFEKGYTDHIADIALLEPCKERYLISPKPKHLKIFEETFGASFKLLNWPRSAIKPNVNQNKTTSS